LKVWKFIYPPLPEKSGAGFGFVGLGYLEKCLSFRPLISLDWNQVLDGKLIFCQKKILSRMAWLTRNKTIKFDLLTLLKN